MHYADYSLMHKTILQTVKGTPVKVQVELQGRMKCALFSRLFWLQISHSRTKRPAFRFVICPYSMVVKCFSFNKLGVVVPGLCVVGKDFISRKVRSGALGKSKRRMSMEGKVLSPKESGEFIVRHAKDVSVLEDGVKKCADEIYEALSCGKLSPRNFTQSSLHPKPTDPKAIDWIFLVDTLNFSFWSGQTTDEGQDVPKWEVKFKGQTYTGYFALCAGVNRAIEDEGLDITRPEVYGSLTATDIERIFRSETSTPIPLVEERMANLREASRVLLEKYQGSFVNCVKACGRNAQDLLNRVVSDFPSYLDVASLDSVTVSLHKRVQILIGDIWACFQGEGLGTFDDIDTLTMFADYRVPQVLIHYGAMKYSQELLDYLEKGKLLANGDRREVEIRGASIHAVELIKARVRERLQEAGLPPNMINSILIDHFLWDYRREHAKAMDKYPYHKTRCIYY